MKLGAKIGHFFKNLDKWDYLAIAILVFAIIIRLMTAQHCLWIDETREMTVARNLLSGEGLTLLQGESYTWHPPGFHLLLAIPFLFGFLEAYAVLVPLFFSFASIILMYFIGKELFNAIFIRDNVSQFTHIVGGILGFFFAKKSK